MHNQTEMESHSEFEDSNTENHIDSKCYDGDFDTESYFSACSSVVDRSSVCSISDSGRSLTDQDKFQLLTSSMNLPRQYRFPVTAGHKFNPSWLLSRPWLHYR